jgi:hypothetical protein
MRAGCMGSLQWALAAAFGLEAVLTCCGPCTRGGAAAAAKKNPGTRECSTSPPRA